MLITFALRCLHSAFHHFISAGNTLISADNPYFILSQYQQIPICTNIYRASLLGIKSISWSGNINCHFPHYVRLLCKQKKQKKPHFRNVSLVFRDIYDVKMRGHNSKRLERIRKREAAENCQRLHKNFSQRSGTGKYPGPRFSSSAPLRTKYSYIYLWQHVGKLLALSNNNKRFPPAFFLCLDLAQCEQKLVEQKKMIVAFSHQKDVFEINWNKLISSFFKCTNKRSKNGPNELLVD